MALTATATLQVRTCAVYTAATGGGDTANFQPDAALCNSVNTWPDRPAAAVALHFCATAIMPLVGGWGVWLVQHCQLVGSGILRRADRQRRECCRAGRSSSLPALTIAECLPPYMISFPSIILDALRIGNAYLVQRRFLVAIRNKLTGDSVTRTSHFLQDITLVCAVLISPAGRQDIISSLKLSQPVAALHDTQPPRPQCWPSFVCGVLILWRPPCDLLAVMYVPNLSYHSPKLFHSLLRLCKISSTLAHSVSVHRAGSSGHYQQLEAITASCADQQLQSAQHTLHHPAPGCAAASTRILTSTQHSTQHGGRRCCCGSRECWQPWDG